MTDSIDSHPVISWLLTEGRRLVRSNEFLEAFALRLRKSGIEVTRVTTGVPYFTLRFTRSVVYGSWVEVRPNDFSARIEMILEVSRTVLSRLSTAEAGRCAAARWRLRRTSNSRSSKTYGEMA